ncbi:MAG: D-alanyl-D-alanine carboxypeptidase [Maribacter sp.]|nr:D-alanyl-D-alanine carboxypeptidase [Maribacter sp.]
MLFSGCSTSKRRIVKEIDTNLSASHYDNQFTGFLLIDPISNDTIYKRNSTKYFTPASNTKIFTLFASLKLLPERIPTLRYIRKEDTLYIQGTGDPALLHPHFRDSTVIQFLSENDKIALYPDNFNDDKFAPGWSWDDYHWYYSPERSALPLYGNVLTIKNADTLEVLPNFFKDSVVFKDYSVNRALQKNVFYFDPTKKDTLEIPFSIDSNMTKHILEKVLKKNIHIAKAFPKGERQTLYGMASDSIIKRMMQESDNFLAEQLLIVASATLSDTLNSSKAREYVLDNYLSSLKQPPRWVDGSGLSRYNLFTPESIVQVLNTLYSNIPKERLFLFFPEGGQSGTLEDWYPGAPNPYIYAKTGSLGNNHNLSGYLITKSGKTLIFSFMNNHFMESSSEIKKRMQGIFERIRDTY